VSTGGSGSGGGGPMGGSGWGGVASCSGPSGFCCGTDSGSSPVDEAGPPHLEADSGSGQSGSDCCAGALHVSVGGTVQGSTCGGPRSAPGSSLCGGGSPVAYIYVDAPAGTQIEVSASTGVSIFSFVDCTVAKWDVCTYGLATTATPLSPPNVADRLFALEHVDVDCGDFMFHAAAR
jgi:hypothetical protein